ncbi:hypothetical protein GGX14DRAFT_475098, partial [Mycena pura]
EHSIYKGRRRLHSRSTTLHSPCCRFHQTLSSIFSTMLARIKTSSRVHWSRAAFVTGRNHPSSEISLPRTTFRHPATWKAVPGVSGLSSWRAPPTSCSTSVVSRCSSAPPTSLHFRKLASQSPLRAIQLSFYRYPGDSRYLWDFAALCPPTLTSFDVRFCGQPLGQTRHEEPRTALLTPVRPASRPPKIRELRIEYSPDAVAFFNDPACPFDLNDVKQLEYCNSLGAGSDSLLRRLGQTVESLKVYTGTVPVRVH